MHPNSGTAFENVICCWWPCMFRPHCIKLIICTPGHWSLSNCIRLNGPIVWSTMPGLTESSRFITHLNSIQTILTVYWVVFVQGLLLRRYYRDVFFWNKEGNFDLLWSVRRLNAVFMIDSHHLCNSWRPSDAYICVSKLCHRCFRWYNGLSPVLDPCWFNGKSKIWIRIQSFSCKKMDMKMLHTKWWPYICVYASMRKWVIFWFSLYCCQVIAYRTSPIGWLWWWNSMWGLPTLLTLCAEK